MEKNRLYSIIDWMLGRKKIKEDLEKEKLLNKSLWENLKKSSDINIKMKAECRELKYKIIEAAEVVSESKRNMGKEIKALKTQIAFKNVEIETLKIGKSKLEKK